jgi:hypothetical protein
MGAVLGATAGVVVVGDPGALVDLDGAALDVFVRIVDGQPAAVPFGLGAVEVLGLVVERVRAVALYDLVVPVEGAVIAVAALAIAAFGADGRDVADHGALLFGGFSAVE